MNSMKAASKGRCVVLQEVGAGGSCEQMEGETQEGRDVAQEQGGHLPRIWQSRVDPQHQKKGGKRNEEPHRDAVELVSTSSAPHAQVRWHLTTSSWEG